MSPAELHIQAITEEITVDSEAPEVDLIVESTPDVIVIASGNIGPQGPQGLPGQWVAMTQAQYDALSDPDPETLYVITGTSQEQWVAITQTEYDALNPPETETLYVIVE